MWVSVCWVVRKKTCDVYLFVAVFSWFGGNSVPFTQFFSFDLWVRRSHVTCVVVFFQVLPLSLFRFRIWMIYFSGFDFVFLLLPHSLTVRNKRSWCFCAISLSFSFHCCLLTAHYIAACFVDSRFFFFFFNYFFLFPCSFYVFAVVLQFCLPKRKR